ncbi:MAG: GNAT family N-acetyltransferase [Candidatus Thiodiazotropha sp.]
MSKNDIEYGLGWRYTPERVAKLIRDSSKNVVVARTDAELVGFGIMTYYQDQSNLDLLAVKRNFRRMKIGSQIVRWLEEVALTAGAYNVFVQVRTRNSAAVGFYESLGYSALDEDKSYYNGVEAALLMVKGLRRMYRIT